MPKASLNPDKFSTGGGGVEAGVYLVTGAKTQNVKSEYKENATLCMILECAVLDKDGDPVKNADAVEMRLSFGDKSLASFHPGKAKSATDEPEDMGTNTDAEGNTIYCVDSSAAFNKSTAAAVFLRSLSDLCGYPKATLDQSWMPSFVGMKFELATLESKQINEIMKGIRLNEKPMKRQDGTDQAITYKVARRWLNPNYLSSGIAGSANGKTESPAGETTDSTPEEIAVEVIKFIGTQQRPGAKNALKGLSQLNGFFVSAYAKLKKPSKHMKAAQALIQNAEWVENMLPALSDLDIEFEKNDKDEIVKIVFPEVA
jgi:hypothetical protein